MTKQELAVSNESALEYPMGGKTILFNNMPEVIRGAELMSKAKNMVPDHLINNPGGCMGIILQAQRWGMDPFAVAQKTHIVSGKIGYEAQLVNAVVTSMAPVTGRLNYEWYGNWEKILGKFKTLTSQKGNEYQKPDWSSDDEDGLGVRVWASFKGETEPRELKLLLKQATVRNSTLWAADPRQQLAYLAVKRWARLYCPDVLLGVYTPDEIESEPRIEKEINHREEPPHEVGARSDAIADKLLGDEDVEDVDTEVPGDDEAATDAPMTFAEVSEKINAAASAEALEIVGNSTLPEFLSVTGNERFREELRALYKHRMESLIAIDNADPANQ